MLEREAQLLNNVIQRKLQPLAIRLSQSGLVEIDYDQLWFMPGTKLRRGDAFVDICPYFYGLDLSQPAHLPIVELPGNIAIEIELIPQQDACVVIIMDATANLNSVRMQQQLANELKLANTKLEQLSRKDALTGLFNRGYWDAQLQLEFDRCKRYQHASTLIMLDIDHFKKVNDTFGHPAGDLVIKKLASILRSSSRKTDVVGRYGGEEFGVILPNTKVNTAYALVERIRKNCAQQLLTFDDGQQTGFTISIGVAQVSDSYKSKQDWLGATDRALYQAKENGRNRSVKAIL